MTDFFQNINRNYKEDKPDNTIERIKKSLENIKLKTSITVWNNPFKNIYSVRIETKSNGIHFGANGKGRDISYALASAYAEFMERIQNGVLILESPLWSFMREKIKAHTTRYYFPDEIILNVNDIRLIDSCKTIDLWKEIESDIEQYYDGYDNYGNLGIICVPFYDINNNTEIYFPLAKTIELVGSTGMASGNTLEEAIYQAMCEILERYAASLVYYNKLTPPTINIDLIKKYPHEYAIIKDIEYQGFTVIIKDFSCNKRIPAIGVILIDVIKNKYRLNIGADTSFQVALSRALTEILQGIGNLSELNTWMLDIPIKEHEYLINNDNDSIKRANAEFEKFTVNGYGVFPYSLFQNDDSYEFNFNTFKTHKTYHHEIKYLINIFSTLDSSLYIRNVSFLGFPTVYIYATRLSIVTKKCKHNFNKLSDRIKHLSLEKQLFPLHDLLYKNDLNEFILNNYSPNIKKEKYYNLSLSNLLLLEFEDNYILNGLPLSYFISLSYYQQKDYKNSLYFWDKFLIYMNIKTNSYFLEIRSYIQNKLDKESTSIFSQEIVEDMNKINIFDNIELPNCPYCESCNLKTRCLTNHNVDFYILALSKMQNTSIQQMDLKNILSGNEHL